jgi:hypothetical protein
MGCLVSALYHTFMSTLKTSISRNLNVRLWKIAEYDEDEELPPLIDLMWIKGHLGRSVVTVGESNTKIWATIGINPGVLRFSKFLSAH